MIDWILGGQTDVRQTVFLGLIIFLCQILHDSVVVSVEVKDTLSFPLFQAFSNSVLLQSCVEVFISLDDHMRGSVSCTEVHNIEILECRDLSKEYVRISGLNLSDAQMMIVSFVCTD